MQKTLDRLDGHLLSEAQALAQLLTRFSPRAPLPIVGGWALSPSALLWLVDFVERAAPSMVVECGSGTSTLWLAHAVRERGAGRVIALEHDAHFAEKTREMLRVHGLEDWAEVRLAPLTETTTPRGTFSWYDVEPPLTESIDLLIVDGPPKTTGRLARYPALPVLTKWLSTGAHILVDDVSRPDEQEAVAYWLEEDGALVDHGRHGRDVQLLQRR